MWGCDGHTGECPDYVIQYQMSMPHMPPILHSEWKSMLHCQIISKCTAKKAPIFEIAERKLHNNSLKVIVLLVRKKPKLTQREWVQSRPSECHSQSVRPSPLSEIAVTSCHDDSPLTSSAINSGCKDQVSDNPAKISGKPLLKTSWVSVAFPEATGRVSHGQAQFPFSLSMYKQASKLRHRQAYYINIGHSHKIRWHQISTIPNAMSYYASTQFHQENAFMFQRHGGLGLRQGKEM
jgi:hypothetical protein